MNFVSRIEIRYFFTLFLKITLRSFTQVDEAEEACNNRKAHLVSILDASENAKVQKLAADNNVR